MSDRVDDDRLPAMERLLLIMRRLRDPAGGCPWDLEQTFASIAPHTIEEAYEVADAIARDDMPHLKEELGDLLFQVVFYARMAEERGLFDFHDIAAAINDKMIRRHPHVFSSAAVADAAEQSIAWEEQKAEERRRHAGDGQQEGTVSALDGIARTLPAVTHALKLQRRAARVGFDWTEAPPVLAKIREELGELEDEMHEADRSRARMEDELGDLLFAVVNLARHLDLDAESALRSTNRKFEHRFRRMEQALHAQGRQPNETELADMEAVWTQIKVAEKKSGQ